MFAPERAPARGGVFYTSGDEVWVRLKKAELSWPRFALDQGIVWFPTIFIIVLLRRKEPTQ